MTTENASDTERRWAVDLRLRFPTLGGEPDLTIQPRACEDPGPLPADAREQPAGHPAFDAAYRVIGRPLIDSGFAERLLHWPADAVQPRSLLAWRDHDAFQFHAGLAAPPNWATVSHLAALAEDLTARLPAPARPAWCAVPCKNLVASCGAGALARGPTPRSGLTVPGWGRIGR